MVNPVFSTNHMRHMTPIFYGVVHRVSDCRVDQTLRVALLMGPIRQLRAAILSEVENSSGEVNIIDWMGRTALELIGQAGLGWSFDPLVEDTVGNNLGTAVKSIMCVGSYLFPTSTSYQEACASQTERS